MYVIALSNTVPGIIGIIKPPEEKKKATLVTEFQILLELKELIKAVRGDNKEHCFLCYFFVSNIVDKKKYMQLKGRADECLLHRDIPAMLAAVSRSDICP